MPDGHILGGLDVKVVGRLATLVSDGAIAGSATKSGLMHVVVKDGPSAGNSRGLRDQ